MMIRRLTTREQVILFVMNIVVFSSIFYSMVYNPLMKRNESLEGRIEKQQKKLEKNLRIIQRAKGLSGEYDFYLEQFKQTKSNELIMSSMISEIEGVARDLNLGISDLKPQRVRENDEFNQFSVSLTINSVFVDIINFLYILQKEPHLFHVVEIRFDKGSRRRASTMKTHLVLSKVLIP